MAVFGWTTYPIRCLVPVVVLLGWASGMGDALQWERAAARPRLFIWNSLVAAVMFGTVKAYIANREIMDMGRWKRVLLLAVGFNAVSWFIALDTAAMLLRGGFEYSSKAATSACAVVAVTTHLRLGWMAVFGD